MEEKRKPIKTVLTVLLAVVMAAVAGCIVFLMIHINKIQKQNDKMKEFIDKNYGVSVDEWDGKRVVFNEADLVDDLSDAIDDALGIYINGNTFEEFVANLIKEMEGEYMDIHEIYDDTQVVEAYRTGDTSNLSEEDLYTLEKATEVINDLITDNMTDYEKEFAIYNWLVGYVRYDESDFSAIPDNIEDYNYYPYGVLKYHSAICVGNATTFKLFMDILGIDCKIIHSTESGEHAWNMVCLDGDWYHVDVTFDSGMGDTPGYEYFNVPDSFKENDGFPWDRDEFPVADSMKYTYITKDAIEIQSIEEVPQLIKNALDEKKNNLTLKSESYIPQIENVVDNISERLEGKQWLYLSSEVTTEDCCIYVISIINEEDIWDDPEYEDPEYTPEDMDRVNDIIEELF
ncbi:MAG: transglutaminase domain-containing protein [Butyrivibrio sp.]